MDIAELGIRVDASQLEAASRGIDEFVRASQRASSSVGRLEKTSSSAASGTMAMGRAAGLAARNIEDGTNAQGRFSKATRASAAHTTNLMFQFQDIGMMLAAGQSPLLLASQQGTQVAGILNQMTMNGQSMRASLVGALRALVNPISLVTIGSLAAGAALFQFARGALSGGEEAKTLGDNVDDLTSAMDQMEKMSEIAESSISDLRDRFGEGAEEARNLAEGMEMLAELQTLRHQRELAESLSEEFGNLSRHLETIFNGGAGGALGTAEALRELMSEFGVGADNALRIRDALREVESATTLMGRNQALVDFQNVMVEIERETGNLPDSIVDLVQEIGRATIRTLELSDNTSDAAEAAEKLADELSRTEQMLASVHQSSDPQNFMRMHQEMSGTADDASRLASELHDAVSSTSMMMTMLQRGFAADPQDFMRQGQEIPGDPTETSVSVPRSVGRASQVKEFSAAQREAESAIRQAQRAAVEYADVERELIRIAEERGLSQETLNDALERAREAYAQTGEAAAYWGRQQENFERSFSRAIVQGENLADVFQNLASKIAEAALQAALFDSGPLGGGGGGGLLGGILGGIFGGADSGPLAGSQVFDIAGAFDSGGRIPRGSVGAVAGFGDEIAQGGTIIAGPSQITSRADTAKMMGGQVVNNINITAPPGSDIRESRQMNSTGGEDLTVVIDKAVGGLARDPSSNLSRALGSNFGLKPTTRGR